LHSPAPFSRTPHPSFLFSLNTNLATASRVTSRMFLFHLRSGRTLYGRDIRRAEEVARAINYRGPLFRDVNGDGHGQ